MSRRRPPRRRPSASSSPESIQHAADGDWVVRTVSGSAATKPYRCPGCDQLIAPATPHVVAWPVEESTWRGGGLEERRHWHRGCWQARLRRARG
jgi:hypothetical protein